jgi:transcriptional regulator with PAS, ATPase and Fis domain
MMEEVQSKAFYEVYNLATHIAGYDSFVLITGESGTGKEILARYIHNHSPRAKKKFVAVNCGALPETLLESELFGHVAGAFTGATKDRIGLFEQANGSTLFLDEIGDISLTMQVKLLRVLQEKEIMRVGESTPRKIDVRVIAATNKNLRNMIQENKFREDLYYRLGVIEIKMPTLRERREDIIPLTRFFIQQFARKHNLPQLRISAECYQYLLNYPWHGNIRELEHAIERASILNQDGVIVPQSLPPALLSNNYISNLTAPEARMTLQELERNYIQQVLKQVNGNRTQAAQILGISPTTLWRKLKESE